MPNDRKPHRALAALVLALVPLAVLAPVTAAGTARGGTPPSVARPALEGVPAFGHVFVIVGENTELGQLSAARAPYLVDTLKPRSAWLTGYHALADGSLADYMGMMTGQFTRCDVQNKPPWDCHQAVESLPGQLDALGRPWQAWMESAANPCDFFDSGTDWSSNVYSTHHDPMVYLDAIEGGVYSEAKPPLRECLRRVLPTGGTGHNDTSRFDTALASGAVGQFNFIIPNGCEQGHDQCGAVSRFTQFDRFLAREVPRIEASPAFGSNGVIVVTYDEGNTPGVGGNVALVVDSPMVHPGVYAGAFDHYSLLRTLEDGFGIGAYLGGAASAPPINQIWG